MGRRHHLLSFTDTSSAEKILIESQLARKSSSLLEDSVSDQFQDVVGLPEFDLDKIPHSPSKRYSVVAGHSSFFSSKTTRAASLMDSIDRIKKDEGDVKIWVELGMKMIDKEVRRHEELRMRERMLTRSTLLLPIPPPTYV